MDKMFCFQCEQTAFGKGCKIRGVCGKSPEVANLQDSLIGAIIALAKTAKPSEQNTVLIIEALFASITNVNFSEKSIKDFLEKVLAKIAPNAPFNLSHIWNAGEDERSLKSLILFGLKGMAAYAHHARVLGYKDELVDAFFYEALKIVACESDKNALLKCVLKTGEVNLKCMELLDVANTKTYEDPIPTKVNTTIEKGPFIIVSGHDLHDLELLLKQSENKGVNIYTHGEMLPCHAYPKLKKYKHLKGNFGTAWQNQQKEFHNVPAAILWTTNCIMPVKDSYKDRAFTTSVVEFPECRHIGSDKDFGPVIEKALQLKGYEHNTIIRGINGGTVLTTGFGHKNVLKNAELICKAIKDGDIKHIFLVGGCDGAKTGRNYYTEFAESVPKNCIILTLACGKYRFNDIDFGDINGIPRLLDMGQCNDAYSAIVVASALAKAFKCTVNDLPLSFVLSWYEQKAVCVLLTLLSLGIRNIYLGPSLPAFLSPEILKVLVDNFAVKPTGNPKSDLKQMLGA